MTRILFLAGLLGLSLGLVGCSATPFSNKELKVEHRPVPPAALMPTQRPRAFERSEMQVAINQTSFSALPGWQDDQLSDALPALQQSCKRYLAWDPSRPIGKTPLGGRAGDWHEACAAIADAGALSDDALRATIRRHFSAYKVSANDTSQESQETLGTFTGYFSALVYADTKRSSAFPYPIYAAPKNINALQGKRKLTRKAIDKGSLKGKGLELLWVSSPVDAFILHIQGSGKAVLPDGSAVYLGYSDNNGHKFKGLLPALEAAGYRKELEGLTMTAFSDWLKDNPKKAKTVMWTNPRYIFFRKQDETAAIGAMGLPLTATRSLAVDPNYIPLGVPLWLNTSFMDAKGKSHKLQRLMVAQDTGSAIKGPIRGDFYWGAGPEASWAASRMHNKGSYSILLPKALSSRIPGARSNRSLAAAN